jgi:acyl-CoA thioesterase I
MRATPPILALFFAAAAACGPSPERAEPVADSTVAAPASPVLPPIDATTTGTRPRVVCLGDSLTAGYGLSAADAYPAILQRQLREAGYDFDVVNAGVSGDTSAGGLRRLDWSLRGDVRVLIVALGGNDALRGLPAGELKANLARIIETAQKRHVTVILAGMEAPPNFGPAYTREFRGVYRGLAAERGVALIPFFLDGVAGIAALNQADGIHPNVEGQRRVAATIWRALQPVLGARASS